MQGLVIGYLGASILLYLLLGGADFGAGIIELFTSSRHRARTSRLAYRSIGPIWEANHMWLIIAIVILFVGFPEMYTTVSVYLHIPLLIMLLGIIGRGTAFVFRHYDAFRDKTQGIYRRIYEFSSCLTPLCLGIVAATVISGRIDPGASSFYGRFILPWWNLFSVAVGLFTLCICGFLASVYLAGEARDPLDRKRYSSKALVANLLAILSGAVVFIAAGIEHIPLARWLFENPVSLTALILASASLIWLWFAMTRGKNQILRVLAAFQVTMILLAITYRNFPALIIFKNGTRLSLVRDLAPQATITALGIALILGSIFILPFLVYLFYNFQFRED